MPYSHRGRVALVSGAASGVGPAYARRLAADGANIVAVDLKEPAELRDELEAGGRRCLARVCDVSSPADVEGLRGAVEERFGGIDILVNNVGISPYTPFERITLAEWQKVMAVNLDSLILMTQAFLPAMKRAGFGRIVNLSSGVCWEPTAVEMVHYATSKLGVVGFTRSLATEVGPYGVTVNAISPGLVKTPLLSERLPPEAFEAALAAQSIKREERPEDLAAVVSFLASDDSAFVTGQTISVDGGVVRL
jgi:NAD(P)-dependent dehydrogenase (short-subunit alcohol dehydrogenase family)